MYSILSPISCTLNQSPSLRLLMIGVWQLCIIQTENNKLSNQENILSKNHSLIYGANGFEQITFLWHFTLIRTCLFAQAYTLREPFYCEYRSTIIGYNWKHPG